MKLLRLLLLGVGFNLLCACGQTGPLYLPAKPAAKQPPPVPSPALQPRTHVVR